MFPDNFYSHGWVAVATGLLAMLLLAVFLKYPKWRIWDWRVVLTVLLFGNVMDYTTTWLFVDIQGIEYEGNELMRSLTHAGWHWFTIYKLGILNIFMLLLAMASRKNTVLAPCLLALGIMLIATAVHNVVAVIRFLP